MNRRKIVYVPHRFVLGYLNRPSGCFLNLPRPLGLPSDVRVLSVHTEHLYNSFAFVVEHPSFDDVPEAVMLPVLHVEWETVRIT